MAAVLTNPGAALAKSNIDSLASLNVIYQVNDNSNPESIVVFSGNNNNNAGYIPGETVHVEVKGPNEETLSCDAIVDAAGFWSCSVNLWETARITGTFYYKARGLQSGVTFTGSFTNDGAIKIVSLFIGEQEIADKGDVSSGSVIDAKITVNSENKDFTWGSTKYQIQQYPCGSSETCSWVAVYTSDCINQPEPDLKEQVADQQYLFKDVFHQTITDASYYFMFTTYSDNQCKTQNGNQWYYSNIFNLEANETTTTLTCNKANDGEKGSLVCEAIVKRALAIESSPTGSVVFASDQAGSSAITPTSCTLAPAGAGSASCTATINAVQAGSYKLQATFQSASDLDKDSSSDWLPVTFASSNQVVIVKANKLEKTYGGVDPALTYMFTPSSAVIAFTGSLSRATGEDAGSYVIDQGTLKADGFTIVFMPGTFTVNKANANIQVTGYSGSYDGQEHSLTGTATGINGEDLSSLLSFGSGFTNAPGGSSTWTFKGNENYLAASGQNVPVVINPIEIVVTADALTKVYGDADPVFTYKVTNGSLLGNDKFSGALDREDAENAGFYVLEKGSLSAGSNYKIIFVSSWFKIDKRPIVVAADPQSKQIGSPDPQLTYHITDGSLMNGDMFSGSIFRPEGNDPGIYPISQGTLYLSENYDLKFTGSTFDLYRTADNLDDDFDGLVNAKDNCVYKANADQSDTDEDGFGDVCDTTDNTLLAYMIVPVTGSSATSELNCNGNTTLQVETGDFVTLPVKLCGLTAILGTEIQTSLPAELPQGKTFLSALNLTLLEGQVPQNTVADPTQITYSFKLPTASLDQSLEILFWDAKLKQGTGGWVELPACSANTSVSLHNEDASEKREIFGCILRENNHRMEFSTNFSGLFVLTSR